MSKEVKNVEEFISAVRSLGSEGEEAARFIEDNLDVSIDNDGLTTRRAIESDLSSKHQNPPPSEIVCGIFLWCNTPQGVGFWSSINHQLTLLERED